MNVYLVALLFGVVAGLRSMAAPAAVSWAARLGWLPLAGTPLHFLGAPATPYILTVLAAGELVADKLPMTPSRKTPVPFGGRILTGALAGAAIGAADNALTGGLFAGVIGAIAGTLGGAAGRGYLAGLFKRDLPAALIEDGIAILLAASLLRLLP